MSKLFGTDGVRGVANEKLTPELAFQIGQAAGAQLAPGSSVVMGRDTRRSGPMLGAALAAGFCSVGVDATSLGVVPTGAVSFIARTGPYTLGAVISASHNPAPDNGIKLIAHDGKKVADEFERRIEQTLGQEPEARPVGAEVGALAPSAEALDAYMEMLQGLVPEGLQGMRVVVDGSNGAASDLGPEIFRRLGADVVEVGCAPDGMNINAGCGATHPSTIQQASVAHSADLGVAFDGDADRAVFADRQGTLVNGDRCMAIWATHWRGEGRFAPPVVVGTIMSNGGFERFLAERGIALERTSVGDKYVSRRMEETGAKIGGEQSGHIIFAELGPTGDGLITALEFARVLRREGRLLEDLVGEFENWPQALINVSVRDKDEVAASKALVAAVAEAEGLLAGRGRLSVRPSGTQPMVRVMAEADDADLRDRAAEVVVEVLRRDLGGSIYSRVDLTHALGD